jgi:hypothetical protein
MISCVSYDNYHDGCNSRLDEKSIYSDVQKYCYFDSSVSYTRNLVSTDNSSYTLLLLCWNNNRQRSPIHNHPGDGCYMRVVSGSIMEQLYNVREQHATSTCKDMNIGELDAIPATLECIATNYYEKNQVAFINDNIGYHSIGCSAVTTVAQGSSNKCTSGPGAISLHLYCPPIKRCQIVTQSTSFSSNGCDGGNNSDYKRSKTYIHDSGPMYHHTEYGSRKE